MVNYNILGHNFKRDIINFCGKLSKGFGRPTQKFITDMVYGLIAGKICFLTEIARSLNEDIALDKTASRLSCNLMNFDGEKELIENYFESIKNTLMKVLCLL